ncbi:hypothetical protein ACFX2C_010032 [Malus domestica]
MDDSVKTDIFMQCGLQDDAVIFCRAQEEEVQEVMDVLQCYADASEHIINREKSSLFFGSKCSRQWRREPVTCANIQGRDEFGKYLGITADFGVSKAGFAPHSQTSLKNAVFEGVQEALEGRINGWAEQFLSPAGKKVLIKAVAMALPNYAMSCSSFRWDFVRSWSQLSPTFGRWGIRTKVACIGFRGRK